MSGVSVNGVCQACRFGEGADRSTNTCVECTPDAVLDWRDVENGQCNPISTAVPIDYREPPNDICPGSTWFEINHLDALTAQDRSLEVRPIPEAHFQGTINEQTCTPYLVVVSGFEAALPSDPAAWRPLGTAADVAGSWGPCGTNVWCTGQAQEPTCSWDAALSVEGVQITAAGNRLRFRPSALNTAPGGGPTPLRLLITGSRKENVLCEPD